MAGISLGGMLGSTSGASRIPYAVQHPAQRPASYQQTSYQSSWQPIQRQPLQRTPPMQFKPTQLQKSQRQVVNEPGIFGEQAAGVNARLARLLDPSYAEVRTTDSDVNPMIQAIDRQSQQSARLVRVGRRGDPGHQ